MWTPLKCPLQEFLCALGVLGIESHCPYLRRFEQSGDVETASRLSTEVVIVVRRWLNAGCDTPWRVSGDESHSQLEAGFMFLCHDVLSTGRPVFAAARSIVPSVRPGDARIPQSPTGRRVTHAVPAVRDVVHRLLQSH